MVVHAVVEAVEYCTEPDDSRAWMFVTLRAYDVLSGGLDDEDAFVVRQRGGVYSDGTVGGLNGTPAMAVGDEIVAPLHFDEDGDPHDLTLRDEDVWYVVDPPFGSAPILVDGTGRVGMYFAGRFVAGARMPGLDRRFPKETSRLTRDAADFAGIGMMPTGPDRWIGSVVLETATDRCVQAVSEQDGGVLRLEATCNLDMVGSVTAEVSIEPRSGGSAVTETRLFETPTEQEKLARFHGNEPPGKRTTVASDGDVVTMSEASLSVGTTPVTVAVEVERVAQPDHATREDWIDEMLSRPPSGVVGHSFPLTGLTCVPMEGP